MLKFSYNILPKKPLLPSAIKTKYPTADGGRNIGNIIIVSIKFLPLTFFSINIFIAISVTIKLIITLTTTTLKDI